MGALELLIFAAMNEANNSGIADPDQALWEDIETGTITGLEGRLLVYNDDFNTFEWVIRCFVEVLNHSSQQAEQLSILIHYKGKATVKEADLDILRPLKDALVERGLSAVIEQVTQ